MPYLSRRCVVCKKVSALHKSFCMTINSKESESKLRLGYQLYFKTELSEEHLIHRHAHKVCYNRVTRKLPSVKTEKNQVQISFEGSVNALNDISSIELNVDAPNIDFNDKDEVTLGIFLYTVTEIIFFCHNLGFYVK
jgi:hypothetical protein